MPWWKKNFFTIIQSLKITRNCLKNDTFPLLKSEFSTSKHICQTYAKMIFELCVIRCTKANMAKHGGYALFLPLKFEKTVKLGICGESNPTLLGGRQICKPLDHEDWYTGCNEMIGLEYDFSKYDLYRVDLHFHLKCRPLMKPASVPCETHFGS